MCAFAAAAAAREASWLLAVGRVEWEGSSPYEPVEPTSGSSRPGSMSRLFAVRRPAVGDVHRLGVAVVPRLGSRRVGKGWGWGRLMSSRTSRLSEATYLTYVPSIEQVDVGMKGLTRIWWFVGLIVCWCGSLKHSRCPPLPPTCSPSRSESTPRSSRPSTSVYSRNCIVLRLHDYTPSLVTPCP